MKYWIYGDSETEAQVVDVKAPQAELRGLYPFCDYEMRVCAYNPLGDGSNTDIIPCKTLEDCTLPCDVMSILFISPLITATVSKGFTGDMIKGHVILTPPLSPSRP